MEVDSLKSLSHHYKHDWMLGCWQVPIQNPYELHKNANISADLYPKAYKERWKDYKSATQQSK